MKKFTRLSVAIVTTFTIILITTSLFLPQPFWQAIAQQRVKEVFDLEDYANLNLSKIKSIKSSFLISGIRILPSNYDPDEIPDLVRELDKLEILLNNLEQNNISLLESASYLNKAGTKISLIGQKCNQGYGYIDIDICDSYPQEYEEALMLHQQALSIYENLKDYNSKIETIGYITSSYFLLRQYEKIADLLDREQETLEFIYLEDYRDKFIKAMDHAIPDINAAIGTVPDGRELRRILSLYGEERIPWSEILEINQINLRLAQELDDKQLINWNLHSIGWAYRNMGLYAKAIEQYQQALQYSTDVYIENPGIFRSIGNSSYRPFLLVEMAIIYIDLAQYENALNSLQEAAKIQGLDLDNIANLEHVYERNRFNGFILSNIGLAYLRQKEFDKALTFFQRAKQIDTVDIGGLYHNLGQLYFETRRYDTALNELNQALKRQERYIADPGSVGFILNQIGTVHVQLQEITKALEHYQRALRTFKELGERFGESLSLANIAALIEQKGEEEVAIALYKQSINLTELIRQDLQLLPHQFQQSYTDSVADTYRHLAELLLQQNRILEAQQVLDLLKVQELDDYLRGVRGNVVTANGVEYWQPEQAILDRFNDRQQTAIALGQELTELRQIPEGDRTPTQQQRIDELVQLEEDLNRQFNDFLESDEILNLVSQLSVTTQRQTLNPEDITGLRENLGDLSAVLLYPLILEDRLELVITTPNSPPLRRTVEVSREELNRTILEFREVLQTPTRNATVPAQKLYRWLIEPLEDDLAAADIDTIIYAPDGQLRYIPLAALHDGDRYLIERYAVNNITARSLTDLDAQPASDPKVLAGAFADQEQSYPVQIGQRNIDFRGLPFAGVEVENLVASLANITSFVDDDFSLDAVKSRLNEHDIIHFATHAAFVPGVPEDSFILFGNGDKPTLADIKNWSLHNVDLVVLSACQTGLGGFGNGEEILGLGYQFQRAGARAAIASLWQVSDRGTQSLMDAFYTVLQNGHSKAEALRRAQVALIRNNEIVLAMDDRGIEMESLNALHGSTNASSQTDLSNVSQGQLSHPYYWAPFILIGNGL